MIGTSLQRKEDDRLIRGEGHYTGDLNISGAGFAVFLRSPVAHARILGIGTEMAKEVPGVIAILDGKDVAGDGLGPIPTGAPVENRDGTPMREAFRPVLPADRARFVGQPLALVVAESLDAARDAVELIELDLEELPPVIGAVADPLVHDDVAENTAFDWGAGDMEAAWRTAGEAPHTVEIDFHQARMAGVPLEGRVAVAEYVDTPDAAEPTVALHLACQGANIAQAVFERVTLKWPKDRLRVQTGDVGGGFGPKFFQYPEQAALAWACWRLKRSIRWSSDRGESFISETHARDQRVQARLGFDDQGRFLAVAMDSDADMGAFLSSFAPGIPTDGLAKILTGLYDVPVAGLRVRGHYTNTVPVDAYRGAGKPPGIYCLERLVDMAAEKLGLDRDEIRRRNLIRPDALPYRTAVGKVLDAGGDYLKALEESLAALDWAGFEGRRTESGRQGKWRGIGLACNLHPIGGSSAETSRLSVQPEGRITAWTGTQSTGQGHETVYAQILAEVLQIDPAQIDVRQGDTAMLPRGGGSGGSSSTVISGNTLTRAARAVLDEARDRAGERLEVSPADLEYAQGVFTVAGTDRNVGLFQLAEDAPLAADHDFADEVAAFPYGVVGAEIELDPDTGVIVLVQLLTTDDAGRIVNPMLLAGQSQGALAQGAGQALLERIVYDPESGQVLTGSFMDYAMPRATDLPRIGTHFIETLSPTNLLGIRGVGELGANGAPAAIANALFDAVKGRLKRPLEIEPPFTPDTVWRALRTAHA